MNGHSRAFYLWGLVAIFSAGAFAEGFAKADGYQGIWYCNEPTHDEYVYKYSGGLGTYCMKHIPMAVYAPEAKKTFFVYGGVAPGGKSLLEMVSYYDHATGQVPKPTILMDKGTNDAHDNPVISIADQGHIWVFASSHGTSRPSYIFKSKKPYDIDDFDMVCKTNFSYPQPWYLGEQGFLFLHTRYEKGKRALYSMTSPDGVTWSDGACYAHIDEGHYQVSWPCGRKVGTAFNYHPKGRGLNFRTNLYYMETDDLGKTWKNASGVKVETPLTTVANDALVHDYAADGLVVYMKNLAFDAKGNPAILVVTSKGWKPGPQNGPHEWRIAHWQGKAWDFSTVTASDNNYDSGSLYVEGGTWRVIGPTGAGPQPFNPGGEVAVWTSSDQGKTWTHERQITQDSLRNHTYVRCPLNAHPDFYAFWADGDTRKPSESRLYFCDKTGQHAYMLPLHMESDYAKPQAYEAK